MGLADRIYYERRLAEEEAREKSAACDAARMAHSALAAYYATRLSGGDGSRLLSAG